MKEHIVKEIILKPVVKDGELVYFQGQTCTVKNTKGDHLVLQDSSNNRLITIHKSNYDVFEFLEPYED